MSTRPLCALLLGTVLAGCVASSMPFRFRAPDKIVGCERYRVEVCWTWVLNGDRYVHRGSDGATAEMEVIRFTGTELVLKRVDYGKHHDFTALYAGMIQGRGVRSGAVTWNHAGYVRAGVWSATW